MDTGIKLATYDGTGEWKDYRSHFEAGAAINNWNKEDMGMFLAAALRGQAQGKLGDLPDDAKCDYDNLVQALEERFAPPNQNELYRVQLKECKQRATETLPELGQAIRRLTNKAYPKAPSEVKETLAKEHFLDALINSEMRIRIKQSRPENLHQAICLAVELEAYYKAEKKYDSGKAHLRLTNTENPTSPPPYEDIEAKVLGRMEDMMKTFN